MDLALPFSFRYLHFVVILLQLTSAATMAKRGRPKKHQTQEDVKSAANAANRASRRRRKVATQSHDQQATNNNGLWVEFDPLSMLQQAGAEGDAKVTAPDHGIQAEGLDVPVEQERLQFLEVSLLSFYPVHYRIGF
jgi:hypothetical protein